MAAIYEEQFLRPAWCGKMLFAIVGKGYKSQ